MRNMPLVASLIKEIFATVPCLRIFGNDLPVLNAPSIKNNTSFFTSQVPENIKSSMIETEYRNSLCCDTVYIFGVNYSLNNLL
jgi:hypothetical protein